MLKQAVVFFYRTNNLSQSTCCKIFILVLVPVLYVLVFLVLLVLVILVSLGIRPTTHSSNRDRMENLQNRHTSLGRNRSVVGVTRLW